LHMTLCIRHDLSDLQQAFDMMLSILLDEDDFT